MAISKPLPADSVIKDAISMLEQHSGTSTMQTYHCKIVTPLYGGGVEAGVVDKDMPIRATAIRGQLRFWWRIAHHRSFSKDGQLDSQAMFKAERDLWGGLGDIKTLSKSKVVIKVVASKDKEKILKQAYRPNKNKKLVVDSAYADVAYALFPAQGKAQGGRIQIQPPQLLQPGYSWNLCVNLPDLNEADRSQVEKAIRWWASFGGVGARTRRGLGSLEVFTDSDLKNPLTSITKDEAKEVGIDLVLKGNKPGKTMNAKDAWITAVKAMRDFRQEVDIGRNKGSNNSRPGRSKWPEPDSIRRLTNTSASMHKPVHALPKSFPRAAFGLPIIFHFKDKDDPKDTTLVPKGKERMASPIILKPYKNPSGEWKAAAIRLPMSHVFNMDLELQLANKKVNKLIPKGTWWPEGDLRIDDAKEIHPLKITNQNEPTEAFLTFFEKPKLFFSGNQ